MSKNIKFYPNGQKKKEVREMIKNSHDFKLIIGYNPDGNINNVMEKPNLSKLNQNIMVSGAHVFAIPEHNHCDFFQSGVTVCKEYPKTPTNYGYTISGSILVI